MNNNISKIKKAIGIDFSHMHGPQPQAVSSQAAPETPQQSNPVINAQQPSMQATQPIQHQDVQNTGTVPQRPPVRAQNISQDRQPQVAALAQRPQAAVQRPQPHPEKTAININPPNIEAEKKDVSTRLFAKIDNHAEIRSTTIKVRQSMKKMIETIAFLAEAEKLKEEAINNMESQIRLLKDQLNIIDNELASPEFSGSGTPINNKQTDEVDGLRSDIESLKSNLSALK